MMITRDAHYYLGVGEQTTTLLSAAPWFLTSPPEAAIGAPARQRLLGVLDDAVSLHPLVLLAAPSGYDKSTLLSAWMRRSTGHTAWLTLTRHDQSNEELVLSGILSALARVDSALNVPAGDSDARELIGRLAEAVVAFEKSLVLVIDDAHYAGPVLSSGIIDLLVSLTAGKLRFVLAGAPELRSWFTRELAQHRALLLSGTDLALTVEELRLEYAFWETPISEADAASIVASTAGWPIAIRLHRLHRQVAETTDAQFSIGDRWLPDSVHGALLTDYIADNVLAYLRPELAEFVLVATTCAFLSPALAQALTNNEDSGSLLEECVAQGLLLTRYRDAQGGMVYRWSDDFAGRCREILARSGNARGRALDIVAARWLAPHFPQEAVTHAMRAESNDQAVDIIRSYWIRVIVESGARVLNAQCLALPQELAHHPEILMIRAACVNLLGDATGAQLLSAQAKAAGEDDPRFVATEAFASLFFADDAAVLTAACDRAREVMAQGTTDPALNAYRLFLLGWVELRLRRDTPAAVRFLESAIIEAQASQRPVLARRASGNLLFALSYGGNLTRARAMLDATDDHEEYDEDWYHYDGGVVLFARGFVDYWQGRTADAQRSFQALTTQRAHDAGYAGLACVYTAFCAADTGSPEERDRARARLASIHPHDLHGVPWPLYRAIAEARLLSSAGDHDRAVATVGDIERLRNVPIVSVMAAEILRAGGFFTEASQSLSNIAAGPRLNSVIAASANLTAALIAHEHGDRGRSRTLFERSLNAALSEGILLPYARRDAQYRSLLIDHAAAGTAHSEFVAARIATFDAEETEHSLHGIPLSTREREIFGYLCTTMTAEEIASALFVSVNTIRTHQRAIYRKLGVTNRREAIRFRL